MCKKISTVKCYTSLVTHQKNERDWIGSFDDPLYNPYLDICSVYRTPLMVYTKNLSADKINLSTFKGEGELTKLELDETVLTELLELPSWVRLTSAWCNKVSFRIQWTKLKTVPIYLVLDEVQIEVETCEELRSMSYQQGLSSLAAGNNTKYSFINKVIDGMTIHVNSVLITFRSPAFTAKVQILRITVESKTPKWQSGDLRLTRLKDAKRDQLMIFKELEWQTLRIEASSISDKNLPPLRLLTNRTRCRITIKKRLSDCFVIGCRLLLILDDLLWVLTDSQLKAALHFIDSLSGLIQKDTEVTRKKKAARKLESLPEYQAQMTQQARMESTSRSNIEAMFADYDFIETSYHFWTQRIDLHFSEDSGAGRSCHPKLQGGGNFHIYLTNFQVDYYPYHLATGDRKHWARYKDGCESLHAQWLAQAHASFRNSLLQLVDTTFNVLPRSGEESPSSTQEMRRAMSSPSNHPVKAHVSSQLAKLMTSCVIMRIEDFTLYIVTTTSKVTTPRPFIKGDKERYNIPSDFKTLHAEFTYYYYPGDIPFPLPPPKFYLHLNPVQVHFDVLTLLWLNSFALNLFHSLLLASPRNESVSDSSNTIPKMYIDVKLEAISPRLIFESSGEHTGQRDRPRSLHFQVGRVSLTNVRNVSGCSRADLAKCIHDYELASLFYGSDFPSKSNDFHVITEKFMKHVECSDNVGEKCPQKLTGSVEEVNQQLSREMLWIESKDVWCIILDPLSADFFGVRAVGSARPVPFIESVTVTVWIHAGESDDNSNQQKNTDSSSNQSKKSSVSSLQQQQPTTANLHALVHISLLVSLQINHYQFLFLLRIADEANELTTFLAMDSNRILHRDGGSSIVMGALIPQLEITFVMPAQVPGKESSGGDLESVIPDSSSLIDDQNTNTSIQWHQNLSTDIPSSGRVTLVDHPLNDCVSGSRNHYLPPLHHTSSLSVNMISPTTPAAPSENKIPFNLSNSVKKGFNTFFTSIDSAFKPSNDDASDTVSLRSDASSDSEKFVMVNVGTDKNGEAADAMFRVGLTNGTTSNAAGGGSGFEMASEVTEEDTPTLTTPSERDSIASSYKRRDLISVVTFKLGQVELLQQSQGFQSSIKLQLSNIEADECTSIPWDEFQSKFSTRARVWEEGCEGRSGIMVATTGRGPVVKARLDHSVTPKSPHLWLGTNNENWFNDLLTLKVNNMELELSLSTLSGLADLVEDEVISQPLPMEISMENVRLHMKEDHQTVPNITSPGNIPIDVNVTRLRVSRGQDGVFHVEPTPQQTTTPQQSAETLQLISENEQLRRRLAAMEKLNEENHYLRRCEEEAQFLKSCLSAAQDNVTTLLEEKQTLLDLLQKLQEQQGGGIKQQTSSGSAKR
ncbi:bridge-like lipid transfer protein family member 3B isoform X2 [Lycorma delicatula]|uniref:bridge-like lipid transfer protein family member 3B isoform X2 n=1 Tax=Lycorma delicatula TaxID=130591 RepID=UPI003F519FE1